VLEVNSTPGLEGIEQVSGVDIAGAIVELVACGAVNNRQGGPRSAP